MTDLITGPGTYADKGNRTAEVKTIIDGLAFGLDGQGDAAAWRPSDGAWMICNGQSVFEKDNLLTLVEALDVRQPDTIPTWDGTGLPPIGAKVEYWSGRSGDWQGPGVAAWAEDGRFILIDFEHRQGFQVIRRDNVQRRLRPYNPDHLAAAIKADLEALPMVESCNYDKSAQAIAIGLRNRGYVHKDDVKVVPEDWHIRDMRVGTEDGFVIRTPRRETGVRTCTSVHGDDTDPGHRLLYEILANHWSNDHD